MSLYQIIKCFCSVDRKLIGLKYWSADKLQTIERNNCNSILKNIYERAHPTWPSNFVQMVKAVKEVIDNSTPH